MAPASTFIASMVESADAQDSSKHGIPYRTLGHTGEKVSSIGLGGWHIGKQKDESESIGIIRGAIDNGINFMDNCWDYNDGNSELRMGKALAGGYRDKVFLMTKIDGRDQKTAAMQINESLKRFQTDRIDLLQFHEIIRMNDPDRIFAHNGAIYAALAAKKAGKIRYIGFTGHKTPAIHLKMLAVAASHGFKFDAVQMPLNCMDVHFDSFEKLVLPILKRDNIGVLGMKPIGSGMILSSGTVTAVECLRYALSLPVSVVITGCDSMNILQQALDTVRNFKGLSGPEREAIIAKTAQVAKDGRFEGYKTSTGFDGTTAHPNWMG
jgi:predicted aldo/keto reductase-like oxidoreductase